jgi:hypothetical protein
MQNMLKSSLSIFALLATPVLADFDDAGTDYSKATVDKWSEDSINDYVRMANSFACILKNSRPDVLPNATYEALIGEVTCGLEDEIVNASGVSNRNTLSSSTIKNSRASATSNQEGQFWFNAMSGSRFVGGITVKKSPTDLPPYGEWGLSYYMNHQDGQRTDQYSKTDSPVKGYVDIASAGGTAVTLRTYDNFVEARDDYGYQTARIEYSDSTLASAKILGRNKGEDPGNGVYDKLVAAKTNATHVFRAVSLDGGNRFTGQCMKRDSTWQTGHEYGLYNKSTGAKVSLSGGFGFNYTEGGETFRGFFGNWGAHFDNPATAFSPSSPTKTVTRQSDSASYTLSWAPGELRQREPETENLPATDGDIAYFKTHVENGGWVDFQIKNNSGVFEGRYYNSEGTQIRDPFNNIDNDDVITTTDITAHPWMTYHLWSEEKRTDVSWDGTGTIKFYSETDVSSDTTLLAATHTSLFAVQNNSAGSNLPIDAAAWQSARDPWGYSDKADSKDDAYYFTGMNPPSGFLKRTLYTDPTGDGPSAGDKPVMFNFSANEKAKTYSPYDDARAGSLANRDGDISPWPYKEINLRDAGIGADRKQYRWRFGAFNWDSSIIALDSDNNIVTIDKPLVLNYAHAASKDLNEGKTAVFYAQPSNNPVPALCPLDRDGTPACSISPASFGTKNFRLRYNGNWIDGFPNTMARGSKNDTNGYWVRMINPKAGTTVTDVATSTEYVLKPLAIGEAFLPEADATKCSDPAGDGTGAGLDADKIDFASRAEFGWTLDQLPLLTDYPLPTTTWASKPALSDLKCTVTMGDASACN